MLYKSVLSIFLLCALLSVAQISRADTLRCKNKLVKLGDTSIEVKIKCGKPDDESFIGQVKVKGKYVNIDRYTYVPRSGQLVKILEFHDGNLVSISNGPRV